MTLRRNTTQYLSAAMMLCLLSAGSIQAKVTFNDDAGSESCIFSQELADPVAAEEFRALVKATRSGRSTTEAVGEFYETDQELHIPPRFVATEVDIISLGCMSCHNGGLAKVAGTELSHGPGSRPRGLPGNHPIGMKYEQYQHTAGYQPMESMSGKMTFVGGKVGCITCHDPLSGEKRHLVMSNESDRLCLSCHAK